ncbi:MAG: helix-hairpin-helix domain-containing protein [Phycisphaerae bacterium]|nr:helix-hairpin-helix domain-containing protein [Phycisphaerae bacterium]
MPAGPPKDWTQGPARFIAAGALGGASVVGLAWAIASGRTPPDRSPSHVAPVVGRPAVRAEPVEPPAAAAAPTLEPGPAEPSAAEPGPPPESPAPRPAPGPLIININTAGAAELELLPGIGPALAKRIIDHRARHGRFRRIDDLDAVSGIGPKTMERLRPLIKVD